MNNVVFVMLRLAYFNLRTFPFLLSMNSDNSAAYVGRKAIKKKQTQTNKHFLEISGKFDLTTHAFIL